jgi:hypothetical protein
MCIILLLGLGLGFDHRETADIHWHLNMPAVTKGTRNHMSRAAFLQYYVGTVLLIKAARVRK